MIFYSLCFLIYYLAFVHLTFIFWIAVGSWSKGTSLNFKDGNLKYEAKA